MKQVRHHLPGAVGKSGWLGWFGWVAWNILVGFGWLVGLLGNLFYPFIS